MFAFKNDCLYGKFLAPVINVYRRIGIHTEYKPINDLIAGTRKISGTGVGEIGDCIVFVGNLIMDFNYEMMSRILKELKVDKKWYAILDKTGSGDSENWYIYHGTIPPEAIIKIEYRTPEKDAITTEITPMNEMKMPLMYLVTLAYVTCFVLIYAIFIRNKSLLTGIKFGALFGTAAGISMGFGSFSFMPIPLSLALGWFAGVLVESVVAGTIVGLVVKPK